MSAHRDPKAETREPHARSQSGVHRVVTTHVFGKVKHEIEAAQGRANELRSGLALRRDAGTSRRDDEQLGLRALTELDTAHEELHVMEEELHAQADAMLLVREAHERERRIYVELFDAAPEAYVITDEQGAILQANRRASALFNRDARFLIGKPLASLFTGEERSAFRDLIAVMNDAVFRTQLRIRPHNDLARRWIELSAQRGVRDESSICVRWMMRDITAQKEEEALRFAHEELLRDRVLELEASQAALASALEREQALVEQARAHARDRDQLLTEVAHELRSPLGAVAGWLHVMSEESVADKVKVRAVRSMTRSVRGLARMVEDLLEHARTENNRVALKITTFNLLRLVIETMEDMRPLAGLKGLRFELDAKQYKIDVSGDYFRVQQVLRNLIGNAIKFTPEHGCVRIAVVAGNKQAVVSISDTGRGIPQEDLSRIFEPFVQLGAGKRHTGLGLGLSIARRLIELHGGSIEAKSEGENCGAEFRVRLPLFPPN